MCHLEWLPYLFLVNDKFYVDLRVFQTWRWHYMGQLLKNIGLSVVNIHYEYVHANMANTSLRWITCAHCHSIQCGFYVARTVPQYENVGKLLSDIKQLKNCCTVWNLVWCRILDYINRRSIVYCYAALKYLCYKSLINSVLTYNTHFVWWNS